MGDLTKAEYFERRERLQRALEGLAAEGEVEAALEQAAVFLSDLPATWQAATEEQRNALARLLFQEVRIKDAWVVAVVPQPSFAPFFDWDCQARRLSSGSDGLPSRNCILPPGAIIIAEPPECRPAGKSGRASYQQPRRRKLSPEQEAAIAAEAQHRTLRDLAAAYNVSPELVRLIVKRARPTTAAPLSASN